jgi:hypothetical protein
MCVTTLGRFMREGELRSNPNEKERERERTSIHEIK